MFCPRCGANQSEDLKFCTLCGANLSAVRQVVEIRETNLNRDPHQEELDHWRGFTPELRRYNEIKGGVITGSIGLAFAIVLHVFFDGLILSGNVSPETAQILSRIWIAGIIPMFIGIALIINGVFVSKRLVESAKRAAQPNAGLPERETNPLALGSGENTEFVPERFSVTEDTTKHLTGSDYKQ